MKNTRILAVVLLVLGLIVCLVRISEAEPMGTAFTYQGRLMDANFPADGLYDFEFRLFDDPCTGTQKGNMIGFNDLDVIDGYFTVELDFGSDVFDGDARWLEIGVQPGGETSAYTKLSPRQEVTPTPYALHTYGLTVVGDNTFIGKDAGTRNTTGSYNAFSGYAAGYSNTTGNYNTFSGYAAGYFNTTGSWNTFSGYGSGYSNTTGYSNTFSGYFAGRSNTTGHYNTFSGYAAGYSNTTGNYNTFSGYRAGYFNTTGHYNTFSGSRAGYSNTEGYNNTFLGYDAGYSNTTGYSNTFSGYKAGYSNTTGNFNTFSGYCAGLNNTTGYCNTFSGFSAGYSNKIGHSNTFSGYLAGNSNTEGHDNTFLGRSAGHSNTTGNYNTYLGRSAGYSNTTGNYNVFIGYRAGCNETGSNKLYIANSDTNVPLIYGDFSTGCVGIGTTSPSENLEVAGNTHVEGELTWQAKTSYVSVSTAAFRPQFGHYNFNNEGSSLINVNWTSYFYYAPVQLPHGATVTKMTHYWNDTSLTSNSSICLYKYNMQGTIDIMACASSTGSAGYGSSYDDTIDFDATIDNSQYSYFLYCELDNSDTQLSGVVIEYTFTEPY